MASGSEHLSPGLPDYLVGHSTPPDALLRDLISETAERFPGNVVYQIGPEQGTFMTMLAGLMGARHAIEVGTFTGYSSICLARGMAADGKLICCDVSEEWTSLARAYWQKAGLADRIELRLGRRSTPCERCRPGNRSTSHSSTPTRPGTPVTGRRSSRVCAPAA